MVAVEVEHWTWLLAVVARGGREEEEDEEEEEEAVTNIKSNNPDLTGGEQTTLKLFTPLTQFYRTVTECFYSTLFHSKTNFT